MLRLRTVALAVAGAGLAAMLAAVPAHAATPAGTVISNTATATYTDNRGTAYATESNEIDVTVQAVASLVVTPKEAAVNPALDGYSVGTPVTRRFTITNTSNVTDAYTIQSATTSAGTITSISFVVPPSGPPISVTVGSTVSPSVAPGGTLFVDVTVNTSTIPVNASWFISIKAQTTTVPTANGLQSDTGQRWALAVPGPKFSAVKKLVNGQPSVQTNAGSSVSFSIAFTNTGALPATNVVVTDVVPVGLHPDVNSVTINNVPAGAAATLVGQTLTVTIPSVAPSQAITIAFNAVVDAATALGTTYLNTAQVRADTLSPITSSPASVFVGVANEVYDAFGGGATPVGGAVTTLTQPPLGTPLSLTGIGVAPNLANANPFTTAGNGLYSFGFGAGQFGTVASDAHYVLTVVAPNYLNRRVAVTLHADPSGTLYSATLTALDGQQLAAPGGFTLVAGPVMLNNVFYVLGNIPMFTAHPLTVNKSVDRSTASAGDRLVFTVTFSNSSQATLVNATLADTLPVGLVYGPGTARVDGTPVEPQINGRTLTWTFATLAPGASHTIVYGALVLPQAQVNATLVNVATVTAFIQGQTAPLSASAQASVGIIGGSFTFNYPITGRVFIDRTGSGRFELGDVGVPGVRLYIEDGEYAVTDHYGRYSFPAVRPGQHVIHLDTTSLPEGVRPFINPLDFENPHSIVRLVHGILDTGMLQDINFALEGPK